ncbi:MAG: hypothetical protein LBS60_04780 [Deltaproteobacteria bacterium]|nr:hypothetical protein [Deltaproteobacteria bacterium]
MNHNPKAFNEIEDFKQFAELNNLAVADPETHRQYRRWTIDRLLEKREKQIIREETLAEGEAEGDAKRSMKVAIGLLKKAKSSQDFPGIIETLKKYEIPENIINSALEQVQESKGWKILRD